MGRIEPPSAMTHKHGLASGSKSVILGGLYIQLNTRFVIQYLSITLVIQYLSITPAYFSLAKWTQPQDSNQHYTVHTIIVHNKILTWRRQSSVRQGCARRLARDNTLFARTLNTIEVHWRLVHIIDTARPPVSC